VKKELKLYLKMGIKETNIKVQDIEFKVQYFLKNTFPSLVSVSFNDSEFKDLLDHTVLEYIKVILYKENNNITV
jgi:hypothetical protein